MNQRTKLGLAVLGAALLVGVLGDILLRATPWGLNVLLWTSALGAAASALQVRRRGAKWRGDRTWLLAPLGCFAAAFAWRDSAMLNVLDALGVLGVLALIGWRARGQSVRLGGLTNFARAFGIAGANALFAALPLVLTDVRWREVPRTGATRHLLAVARGLALAVPLLLLFGALFVAADAAFESLVNRTFHFDAALIVSHAVLVLSCAWLVGGFLRGMLLADALPGEAAAVKTAKTELNMLSLKAEAPPQTATHVTTVTTPPPSVTADMNGPMHMPPPSVTADASTLAAAAVLHVNDTAAAAPRAENTSAATATAEAPPTSAGVVRARADGALNPRRALGAVEIGVVLGSLNVLFASFVLVQLRYFFGGAAWVMSAAGVTYADYARRGFFELVWVAALVLPLLLGFHHLLREGRARDEKVFRLLAGTQVALLFVIMASAIGRMRLYQSEYGLTELRVYTTAFMFWLALVFVWFAWTVLARRERARFAAGALIAGCLVAAALHLLNPDALIVRANAALVGRGHAFDAAYAASLSADAAPALLRDALPRLSPNERCRVARQLLARWSPDTHAAPDWRTWNWSRAAAARLVAAHNDQLRAVACVDAVNAVPVENNTTTTMITNEAVATTEAGTTTTPTETMTMTTAPTDAHPATPAVVVATPDAAGANRVRTMHEQRNGNLRRDRNRRGAGRLAVRAAAGATRRARVAR